MRRLDLPPIWLALFMAAASLWARLVDIVPLGPEWLWPGRLVAAGGAALILWAAWSLLRRATPIEPRRDPRVLVTDGPFRWTRNPIYRGLLLLLAGWVLSEGEATGLILVPLYGRVLWTRFVLPEEATARRLFGPAYARWAAEVRWRL